jgi:hypothetical protein
MAYYLKDIQWFSFAFVMGTMSLYFMVSAQMQHASAGEDELKAGTQPYKVVVMLMPTALIRLFMMIKMSNIRTAERRIETFSSAIWLSLVGCYAGIWALYGLLSVKSAQLCSFLSLDTVIFINQVAFYYYNAWQEK